MHHNTTTTQRKTLVVLGVVLIHGLGLWLLQSGLLQNVADVVVPVQVISTSMDVNQAPAQVPPVKATPSVPPPLAAQQARLPTAPPQPNQAADSPNASNAPSTSPPATVTPSTATATATATTIAPATSTAPAKVQLPIHDAAYLQNPKPDYPALSVRRGEQGQVVLNVLIGVDGKAQKAEVAQSSGFERLDAAALATVQRWRYVPGKRSGVPEAMWFKVPLAFVLD